MKTKIENTDIFKEVIDANVQTLSNRINSTSFDFSIMSSFNINNMTEDEARYLAVQFFAKMLTERVQELSENAVNKLLMKN